MREEIMANNFDLECDDGGCFELVSSTADSLSKTAERLRSVAKSFDAMAKTLEGVGNAQA